MKKFFSVILLSSFCFSPCVLAQEADLSGAPADIRLQKITEEANHKTLIIKDKDEALEKIESLSKQIKSLQDENKDLTDRLHAAAAPAPQPAAESVSFLQNSFNLQSAKLKQAAEDKNRMVRRAD